MIGESEIYCPICDRVIIAENKDAVIAGIHDAYIFVHDDIPHADWFDEDFEAMKNGVN